MMSDSTLKMLEGDFHMELSKVLAKSNMTRGKKIPENMCPATYHSKRLCLPWKMSANALLLDLEQTQSKLRHVCLMWAPFLIEHLNLISEWQGLEWRMNCKMNFLKWDWTMCSNYIIHSRFNYEHSWDHFDLW